MVNAPAWAGILGLICLICSKAAAPGPELGARLRGVTDEQRSRRPIFIATLRAGASWLFFRVARSTRMTQIWVLRSRLEKQPTDLRQYTCYFGDRTLGLLGRRRRTRWSAPVPMLYRSKSLPERWIERIPAERSQFSVAHAFAGPAAFSVQISRTK